MSTTQTSCDIMNHQSNRQNMCPFQKSRFVVRISSRITTVLRVVDTIKQTITDLMSHLQFHSLN